ASLARDPVDNLIQTIAVYALPVLFAITLHEAAHGYVARYFGDPTAAQAGRISLNPLRHIDPMGTIVVPLVLLFATKLMGGGLLFGWAKPVPVNWSRLRRPKRDMLWVALAGPASNLLMADRKSTRLNSSHVKSSYAVFCLKKKKSPEYETTESLPRA